MDKLALTINGTPIEAPREVPTGGSDTLGNLISMGMNLLFVGGVLIAVMMIVYSGIQWILSAGDKERIQQARDRLTYTIIGVILIAAAFFIVKTVIILFGGNASFWPSFF